MELLKKIKEKKKEKIRGIVVRYGLFLFGFNVALMIALTIVMSAYYSFAALFVVNEVFLAMVPLMVIFLFAGFAGVIWFRLGQHFSDLFRKNKILYSWLIVLLSLVVTITLLFIAFVVLYNFIATISWAATLFFGALFVTIISIIFELPIISLGIVSKK